MPRTTPLLIAGVLTAALVAPVAPAQASNPLVPISSSLARTLTTTSGTIPVFVHGTSIGAARQAAADTGLTLITTWNKIGVAVARGTAEQIAAVRGHAGVTYVEGDQPLRPYLSTSNVATRGEQARAELRDGQGRPVDGRGVSAAIIDTGVDGTHPFFRNADGSSAVKLNLKNICGPLTDLGLPLPLPNDSCFLDLTAANDTDTLSAGGHGTHVAGIVAGRDTTLTDGTRLHGAAPGATLISLSVGAGLSIFGADSALNWVLEHHLNPCAGCPPIKVSNNSYGPGGGGVFDSNSATTKLQRALAAEGVVTVWAAGNDGPDNSATNPPGQDPTPGIIMVASYDDQGTGTRDGSVSTFSSRGAAGRPETYPDVAAPGSNITSACRTYLLICSTGLDPRNGPGPLDLGTFNTISGTSMATPHIVGIVTQLFQVAPNATPAQVEDALKATAYKFTDGAAYQTVGPYTTAVDKGTGLVDAYASAVRLGATPA
ncbi:S8 family serine peptidase [Micromonospora sp. DR5-3]|uniref:S8 family serine peptidase n=1 Tax=unclassified Micromonospora TaxID=2617518 RepID=UPI0011D7F98A|nr:MULTISPECIES: S8 family serine peptidase [unclassified Micromonospora]MCW3817847.1 S8 family serine peptidase [Micromonospora sp. DR5-3]TYC22986.1 S8 family serine peptidase [Micromonospora sp. MP36]